MFSFLAADTSPKWLLILFVCSGNPELIKDPVQSINCQRIEQLNGGKKLASGMVFSILEESCKFIEEWKNKVE